jgi:hypothetical protein
MRRPAASFIGTVLLLLFVGACSQNDSPVDDSSTADGSASGGNKGAGAGGKPVVDPIGSPCGKTSTGGIESRRLFQSARAPKDEMCVSEEQTRTCSDGIWGKWSGSFTELHCLDGDAEPCGSLPEGTPETRIRYESAEVPWNQKCVSEMQVRQCREARLTAWSGAFTFESCRVTPPRNCVGVKHLQTETRIRFNAAVVAAGGVCDSEVQKQQCLDGVMSDWSGTFTNEACAVSCVEASAGASVTRTRFRTSRVNLGSQCESESQTGTCRGGVMVWTGSYFYESCGVDCGSGIAHGNSQRRTRFATAAPAAGESCKPEVQTRSCNNGTTSAWTGTFAADTCDGPCVANEQYMSVSYPAPLSKTVCQAYVNTGTICPPNRTWSGVRPTTGIAECSADATLIECKANFVVDHINTTADLDAIADCDLITGNLTIWKTRLTDLARLSKLKQISGNLTIGDYDSNVGGYEGNPTLTSLNGLQNLRFIGGSFLLRNNDLLTDLSGLDNLQAVGLSFSIGGSYTRGGNRGLTSLGGLGSLEYIGEAFAIDGNPLLKSIQGLNKLKTIRGDLSIYRSASLTDLSGLEKVSELSTLVIVQSAMTSLKGLDGLRRVTGFVSLFQNEFLSTLNGLSALEFIGDNRYGSGSLMIRECKSLVNLVGLGSLRSIAGSLDIGEVPAPAGNASLLNLSGAGSLESVGTLSIHDNPGLTSIEGLSGLKTMPTIRIQANQKLTGLTGFPAAPSVRYATIVSNPALLSLIGMENVAELLTLTIQNNAALESLNGLSGLKKVGQLVIGGRINNATLAGNPKLASLKALSALGTASADVDISNNPSLTSLDGLQGLTAIGGNVQVASNKTLTNLTGLDNLVKVYSLVISDNSALASLAGLKSLKEISQSFELTKNPVLPNVNGMEALGSIGYGLYIGTSSYYDTGLGNASLVSLKGLQKVFFIGGNLYVRNNVALPACEATALVDAIRRGNISGNVLLSGNTGVGTCL